MNRPFYKSLDKEFELFGIKGRWVRLFLYAAAASLVVGVVVGFATTSGIGVVTVIVLVVLSFFACLTIQARIPGRQVPRVLLSGKVSGWVVRRETLSRIVLEDGRYDAVKKIMASRARADRPNL